MSPTTSTKKAKQDSAAEADPALLRHIESLHLGSVAEYLDWCSQHGFSRRIAKHWRQRLAERSFAHRAVAAARLMQKRREKRQPRRVLEQVLAGELAEHELTQAYLRAIFAAQRATQACRRTRLAFAELVRHVATCSELLTARPAGGQLPLARTYVDALLAMARHSQAWLRPATDWKPRTHNARRQFNSLAGHLFCTWPAPAFMDSVWFGGDGPEAKRRQGWFLHLGRGHNLRTADLPLDYTKRMAHHFLQSPADYSVGAALRWGQIQGLGGGERLVRAVVGTRLGEQFEHEEFWATVLRFFVAHPLLDPAQVGPIVDFIHQQRFVSQDVFVAPGRVERQPPPQPNFTMKGRTPESLLRQVAAWHRTLAKTEQVRVEWRPSGIERFQFTEGNERSRNLKIWTITELLSSQALVAEGRTMKHCVASYAHSCANRRTSIWTLEAESFEGRSKLLTIEVLIGARRIVQARGKCNMLPAERHLAILRRWAAEAGLTLSEYVKSG